MGNHIETELKLQITNRKLWCDILTAAPLVDMAKPGSFRHDTLEACYYDSPRQALKAARLAYRIRREGGQWVATVKGGGSSAGGLHTRQEYNVVVDDCTACIRPFAATPIGESLQAAVGDDKLMLLFITRFERRTLLVQMADGSIVEAATDRGEIIAGDRHEPIMELELELKEGNPAALLELGAMLAERYPLLLEPRSKYYRGLLLAGFEREDDCHRNQVKNTGEKPTILSMIAGITGLLNAQSCFLRQPHNPDSLHRLQSGVAGLIQSLAVVQPDLPGPLFEYCKTGLHQFRQEVDNGETEEVASALGAGRYTALLLKLWAWASNRD